jgi:MarR family transcriptional regulator, lower aerobic nicotinate degradation pathway regulator
MPQARRSDADDGGDAPDLGLVDGLVQASFAVQGVLTEIAAEHELSIVQLRLLGILRDRQPRMAELARVLGLTKSSASGLIDRAARRGLVARATIPVGDERAVHVAITPGGRQLIDTLAKQVAARLGALLEDLRASDRKRLSLLLTELVVRDAELRGVDLTPQRSSAFAGDRR